MPNYKKLYFNLLGEVSDTIEALIATIRKAEEAYCEDDVPDIEPHPVDEDQ